MDDKTAKRNLAIAFWLCYFLDAFSNLVAWDMNPKVSAFTQSRYFGSLFFIMGFVINVLVPLTEELIPLVIGAFIGYFKEAFTGKEYNIADIEAWNLPTFLPENAFKFKKPEFKPKQEKYTPQPQKPSQVINKPQTIKPSMPSTSPKPTPFNKPEGEKLSNPYLAGKAQNNPKNQTSPKLKETENDEVIKSFLDDDWSGMGDEQIKNMMTRNLNRTAPDDFV